MINWDIILEWIDHALRQDLDKEEVESLTLLHRAILEGRVQIDPKKA